MSTLHRTQIYLGEDQMRRLKVEAARKHVAVSKLIRLAIELFFRTGERKVDWNKDPLIKVIGKIQANGADSSVNHDYYLYGSRKKA